MIVNVASECGFTAQYEGLQHLADQHPDDLVILGVPCNDFGGQEPGTPEEIAAFCLSKFGVTFPMTDKVGITKDTHPLYQADIPGKSEIKNHLTQLVDSNKLPHAMLILGGQGTGKLAMALALASYLQCEERIDGDACGKCNPCLKTGKVIHPDIHFAFPCGKIEKRKREDIVSQDFLKTWRSLLLQSPYFTFQDWREAMGDPSSIPNINVKECKAILHKLGLQTYENGYKVQIIWHAEYLRKEGNRLLKLIEEPTPDTILILIAESEDMLLNTIVSRCQIFKMKRFEDEEIKEYLQSKGNSVISDQTYFIADGDLSAAIKYQAESLTEYSEMVLGWLRVGYQSHPDTLLPFVDKLAALSRDQRQQFIHYMIHFFRQYLIYLYTKDHKRIRLSDKEREAIIKITTIIDIDKAREILAKLEEGLVLLNRNINAKILFTKYTMDFGAILKPTAA